MGVSAFFVSGLPLSDVVPGEGAAEGVLPAPLLDDLDELVGWLFGSGVSAFFVSALPPADVAPGDDAAVGVLPWLLLAGSAELVG